MNGAAAPQMSLVQSVAAAENLAHVIYNLSERCLMAHTLRAVESQHDLAVDDGRWRAPRAQAQQLLQRLLVLPDVLLRELDALLR